MFYTKISEPFDQMNPTPEDTAAGWIDIWVLLRTETCSLEAAMPELPIPAGRPIRWRFRRLAPDGSIGPLPKGWTPMVGFTQSPKSQADQPFGPFDSLLHMAEERAGGVSADVIGEWSAQALEEGAPRRHFFFAMVHRGMGMESDRAFSCLTTARLSLTMGPSDDLRYQAQPTPDEHRVDLSVRRDPKDRFRLRISPEEPVKAFTNSTVRWQFETEPEGAFPMILFYHSTELGLKPGGQENGSRENEHFDPCGKARFSRKGVEMWDFKSDPRSCFYEAATLGIRALSLELFSTGDPQLDNQGIPFPSPEAADVCSEAG